MISREGKHQIWQRETVQVQVPQTLKSQWTVQSIVKQLIEAERD
ncbi:MAG: hypothetical protein O3A10_08215 [Chloroflexi bacterium]|nr:hypothetical protein [Chloroflexota bacterium]MDA1146604.1 hypothetical protein [Chloroflexota bacterium]